MIGRSFTFDVVRAASGRGDDETTDGLDEIVGRGLVRELDAGYDFTHGKLRELVYEQTGRARRRLLHRRVAEALLRSGGAPAAARPASAPGRRRRGRRRAAPDRGRARGVGARVR